MSPDRGDDQVVVPVVARLRHSLEGLVVDVDEPEALLVALRPFEVVEQRPDEVAGDRHAVGKCRVDRVEVALEVGDAARIVDAAVRDRVLERGTVLGHDERRDVVLIAKSYEQLVQEGLARARPCQPQSRRRARQVPASAQRRPAAAAPDRAGAAARHPPADRGTSRARTVPRRRARPVRSSRPRTGTSCRRGRPHAVTSSRREGRRVPRPSRCRWEARGARVAARAAPGGGRTSPSPPAASMSYAASISAGGVRPPVIAMPSSSFDTVGWYSPTIRPS